MKAPLRRRLLILSFMTVILAAVVYGFLPRPLLVEVAKAERGPLRVTVEEEGRTQVRDRFVVSAPVSGHLRRITLEAGDSVRQGSEVAVIEPPRSTVLDPRSRAEAEAAVRAAQASVNAAREKARASATDEEYAKEREGRMKRLKESGHISQDDYNQAETAAKRALSVRLAADAAATAAEADLARARSALDHSATGAERPGEAVVVRAPVSGRVLKVHHESEGVVNGGDPLLDIGDPAVLEVRVEVLSSDAVKLQSGTPVLFERWGGDTPLKGEVRVVEPSGFTKVSSLGVEEQRVAVITSLTSPPDQWQRLGDGFRLDAVFILWEGMDVLQVPAGALFRAGDGWALYVAENGSARLRKVEIGKRSGLAAEVLAGGVSEGDTVITNPEGTIRDGRSIRIRDVK